MGSKKENFGIGDGAGADGGDWRGDGEVKSMTEGLTDGWFTFAPLKVRYLY